ncbi:MAG: hypothetical protein JW702_08995 [Clostridiales bacterium]|nr:hypothetical protein [Clostridiales bacterium]
MNSKLIKNEFLGDFTSKFRFHLDYNSKKKSNIFTSKFERKSHSSASKQKEVLRKNTAIYPEFGKQPFLQKLLT